jgi:hypothetical protein
MLRVKLRKYDRKFALNDSNSTFGHSPIKIPLSPI